MTDRVQHEITLESTREGKSARRNIVAKYGNEPLHADTINPASATSRKRFVKALAAKCSAIDNEKREAIENELLAFATNSKVANQPVSAVTADDEVDVGSIVRPELFHTHEVSGIAIPLTTNNAGRSSTRCALYLRWHSEARRERTALTPVLALPTGGTLYLHPIPTVSDAVGQPAWSMKSRRAWLAGATTPDAVDVFKRLCERIAWFLDFPPECAPEMTATIAVWTIFTYAYPAWPSLPYLSIGGPMESGKSTLLGVLGRICFRPVESSSMTAPCLFRTLDEHGGTLLLDETERLKDGSPDASEFRAVLNAGYKRGGFATRMEKVGESFKTRRFNVYGPKVFAAIATPPEVLASRCIRLLMFRAAPGSLKPKRRLDADPKLWADLRDDLHFLALEHGQKWLALADCTDICPASMSGRQLELWQPLLAIASWLESCGAVGLLRIVESFATHNIEINRDESIPDADETLLRLLARHVQTGTNSILKCAMLAQEARQVDPATFGTNDKPKYSDKGIGTALKKYGLRTKKGSGNNGRTFAGVTLADLRRVERSYGFDLGLPPENVSNVPHVPQRIPEPVTV